MYPVFLPDGHHFLYYIRSPSPDRDGIYVKSIDADASRFVVHASSNFAFVKPGYLLYARDGALLAQPFDAGRAETTGDPFMVADHVERFAETALAAFSASESGVLVYRTSGDSARSTLVWFDRHGTRLGTIGDTAAYRNPRLSPEGERVAVEMVDSAGNRDIWIIDAARGVPTRFTFDPARDASPVWSNDGRTIGWQGNARLYAKPSTGAGREESLADAPWIPDDWLPDGSGLLCHAASPREIVLLPLRGEDRRMRPVVQSRGIVTHARMSADGRWVAFIDNASGRFEVFVQDFAGGTERWQISTQGGIQPKWRRDGKELFYLAFDGTIMSVSLALGALAEIGKPTPLFQTRIEPATGFVWHQYDVAPDGRRFLVNAPEAVKVPLTVVINWPATVKQ
jgi:Tol biopolymer transport system component